MAWRSQQGGVELPGAEQLQQEAVILGHTPPGDESVICCRAAAAAAAGRIPAVLDHVRLYHAAGDGHNAGRVWEMAVDAVEAVGTVAAVGTAAGGIAAVAVVVVAAVGRILPVEALRHAVVESNLVSVKTHE